MIVRQGGTSTPQSLVYDPENRLMRFAQAGTNFMLVQYGYGADGTRLWKWNNQSPTNLQVWIGNIYEEKGGKTLFHIYAGGEQVCTFENGSPLAGGSDTSKVGDYYHQDNLNSSSALSNSGGTQTEVNVYYPFGRVQTANLQASFKISRQFTGQIKDDETGLYYYNARYYDSELGRFIQADTEITDFSDPQSYNRYSYVLNDPLRYTDPTGHGIGATAADAMFNTETLKSSWQLMTMHDNFANKLWEVPVAGIGMAAGTVDAAFNVMTLGGKGAIEGSIKETVKVGVEELGKVEGEKATVRAVEKDVAKDVPNPFGKKGGPEHQAKVEEVQNDIESRGLEAQKEKKIETPGGNKDTRYADVVAKDSKGNVVEVHQVGRQTQEGLPVSRERKAIQDIGNATGQTPQFHPYNPIPQTTKP